MFTKSTDELFNIVKKLSELYIKNEDYEYMSFYTKEYILLRDGFSITKDVNNVPYNRFYLPKDWHHPICGIF